MPRSRSVKPVSAAARATKKAKAGASQAAAADNAAAAAGPAVPSATRAGRPSTHAVRRPRQRPAADLDAAETGDRQFVAALARGLEVLSAFRPGDGRLGNQELAERTGLPKPTVSRITHTLTRLGYLNYNQRLSQYELGSATLSLGYTALSGLDVRRIAQPLMQELANATNLTVGLGLRDKLKILHIEACEGHALVGLRLFPGFRVPITTTAIGRAYLSAAGEAERTSILDEVRSQYGDEWPRVRRGIERAMRDIAEHGFCSSIGDWQKDINAAGAAVAVSDGRGVFALTVGGPAYLVSAEQVQSEIGPMIADVARRIVGLMGGAAPLR